MGNTPNGLPYPEPTEPVAGGAVAIKGLATKIDPRLPRAMAAGTVPFPSTAANQSTSVTVTLPVGAGFTAAPSVQITPSSTAPSIRDLSVSAPSATNFVAVYFNSGTSAAGVGGMWIAVQPPTQSATLAATTFDAVAAAGTVTVTCPTEGCENQGVPIDVPDSWVDDEGVEHQVDAIMCGACGTVLGVAS